MATTVQLQLTLDASGAVTGITQLGDKIKSLPAPPKAITEELKRGQDAAKLFNQVLGVEMPKGLETLIGQSKTLGPLLSSAFSAVSIVQFGFAIIDVIEKIEDMITEHERAREAWLAVKTTAQDASESIENNINAQKEKFIELTEGPIKAMAFRLEHLPSIAADSFREIADQMKDAAQKLQDTGSVWSMSILGTEGFDKRISKEAADDIRSVISQMNEAMHNARLEAPDDLLAPFDKELEKLDTAMSDLQTKINNRSHNMGADKSLVDPLKRELEYLKQVHDQVEQQKELQVETTKTQSAAAEEAQQRAYDQVIGLEHQTREEQKKGIARIHQQEVDAIEDVERKQKDSTLKQRELDAIKERALNQRKEVVRGLEDEVIKAEHEAEVAGLKGEAAVRAAEDNAVGDLARSWQERTGLTMAGLQKDTELWDLYTRERTAIEHKSDVQIAEMRHQAMGELTEAESQAHIASLSEWDRGEAEIVAGRDRTLRQIAEKMRGNEGDPFWDKWAARESVAAWATADAKIRDEHKRRVEQLGSDLESVFDDISNGKIGERILKNMKKFFFQIVAAWLEATGIMKTIFGAIIGTLVGGPGSTLEQASGGGLGSLIGLFSGLGATVPATATPSGFSAASGLVPAASFAGSGSFFPASGFAPAAGFSASGGFVPTSNFVSSGGPAAGGALTTVHINGPVPLTISRPSGGATAKAGLFANLFSKGGVATLAGLGAMLGGQKFGGTVASIGGMVTALGLMAAANPAGPAAALLAQMGLGLAGAAALGPGLLGFGIGMNTGPVLGAIAGGGLGAGLGGLIGLIAGAGGPMGLLIGGIAGLIGGLIGGLFGSSKRKRQANAFANTQVLPAVAQIEDQYKNFSLDYTSAISQLEDLRKQAQDQLGKLKSQGRDVMKNVVTPAIDHAEADINGFEAERQRRAALTFGPPEFHTGGFVDTMTRSFTRRPGDLLAVLKRGEFVVNPQATAKNRRTLEAINAGGSAALSVGEIHIHPATLDRAYVRTGFKQDLLDALNSLRKEGRL